MSSRGSNASSARAIESASRVRDDGVERACELDGPGRSARRTAPARVIALPSIKSPMTWARRLRCKTTIIMLAKTA